jgi:hypothetical protein
MALSESLLDSKSLWLTPNTETVYASNFLDLKKDGPIVIESPPNVLGILDDMWMRYVGDIGTALESFRKSLRIYPLAEAGNPPAMDFKNISGVSHNTIHANNNEFYEELNAVIQEEHENAIDADRKGWLALLDIIKGHSFNPDDRMKSIMDEAAFTGAAIARTISWSSTDPTVFFYEDDPTWFSAFAIGNHEFMAKEGWLHRYARSMFTWFDKTWRPGKIERIK